MEAGATIKGLDSALMALQAAFPKQPKIQQRILHGSMAGAARKTILPVAKQLALRGDGSGALSESLAVRVMSKRRRAGRAAGVEVVPVRANRKALAMYIQHYFTNQGLTAPAEILTQGIRHGHLREFGTSKEGASPFLWPATSATPQYTALFAKEMKKRTESNVRRAAKKRSSK